MVVSQYFLENKFSLTELVITFNLFLFIYENEFYK